MRGARAVAVVAMCVVAVGCAGDDGDDAAAGDEDGGSGGAGTDVTVVDLAFDPTSVSVDAGGTVTWTNEDGVGHTVTAGTADEPGDAFDEALDAGGSVDVTLDEAGTFPYRCTIHSSMTGEVVVS